MLGHGVVDADLAACHRCQADETAHLGVIGLDLTLAPTEPLNPLYVQHVAADALYVSAKGVQEMAEILHVRLTSRIEDRRVPFGEAGGHNGVFCARNACFLEEDLACTQLGGADKIAAVELGLRAQGLKGAQVRANAPSANHATAWRAEPCLSKARKQRSDEKQRTADPLSELRIQRRLAHACCTHGDGVPVVLRDARTEVGKQCKHCPHVQNIWQVANRNGLVREECGGKDGLRRILVAAWPYFPAEREPSFYDELSHELPPCSTWAFRAANAHDAPRAQPQSFCGVPLALADLDQATAANVSQQFSLRHVCKCARKPADLSPASQENWHRWQVFGPGACDKVAEAVHVQHLCQQLLPFGRLGPKPHAAGWRRTGSAHRPCWLSAGQARRHWCKHIAPMKGAANLGQPEFRPIQGVGRAGIIGYKGENAIVGCDEKVASRAVDDCPPWRAHAGVDNGHVHGAPGEEKGAGVEHVSGRADGKGRDLVGDIHNGNLGGHADYDPLHCRNIAILCAEIREERHDPHSHQRCDLSPLHLRRQSGRTWPKAAEKAIIAGVKRDKHHRLRGKRHMAAKRRLADYHAVLAIAGGMEVDREEYLAYMTFRANERPLFTELFGPIIGLKEEWAAQGATPEELDLSAFRYRRPGFGSVPVNTGWLGTEEEEILYEDEEFVIARDHYGRRVKLSKKVATLPLPMEYPVRTIADWRRIRHHYEFSEERFTPGWEEIAREHLRAGRVVTVSIPGGFDEPRQLLGEEQLALAYYDQPELVHEILETIGETAYRVLERVSAVVTVDQLMVHEDMAGKSGPLAGPRQVREFIAPYYRRVWDMLRERGAQLFGQDSDGNMNPVIPAFLEAGVNLMYPMEPAAGMDIVALRKEYGTRLAFMGGIDKHVLRRSREEIVAELEYKIPPMVATGGCVLGLDHRIPNGTPLANYRFYIEKAWEIMDREAAKLHGATPVGTGG